MLSAYLTKCVEFKRFDVVKDVYNTQIKQGRRKIPSRCIVPLLEAAMLEAHESSPSSKNKKFHAGFKFYRDEIRQRNKKLNSSEYHEIISTFRSDIMDKNCIYMRYQADKIFAEGLREGAIIMPSSINKNGLIEKWDLHQIFNRQTVLVAVRYICRNFGIRENGEAEKRNIEIVIGRGASEGKAHRYMGSSGRISDKVSVASEYLPRRHPISYHGKGGSILLMDTRSFSGRKRCRKIMRSLGRTLPQREKKVDGKEQGIQEGSRHSQLGWLLNAFGPYQDRRNP